MPEPTDEQRAEQLARELGFTVVVALADGKWPPISSADVYKMWELLLAKEAALAQARRERDELRTAFGHHHVASHDADGLLLDCCADCGLDLRDEIHFRVKVGE